MVAMLCLICELPVVCTKYVEGVIFLAYIRKYENTLDKYSDLRVNCSIVITTENAHFCSKRTYFSIV